MTQTIPLIETEDGFEAVRNAMANILAAEIENQKTQATAAELDPADWDLDIFVERANPWELFRDREGNATPIVNIWYEQSGTEGQSSNAATRQTMDSRINVDCMFSSVTEETAEGQESGDKSAMLGAQRRARIVRRILMHPKWQNFGLLGTVHTRVVSNRQAFFPTSENRPVEHVAGVQLAFRVRHNETIDLETIGASEGALITIKRDPEGAIIAQMDFDWT